MHVGIKAWQNHNQSMSESKSKYVESKSNHVRIEIKTWQGRIQNMSEWKHDIIKVQMFLEINDRVEINTSQNDSARNGNHSARNDFDALISEINVRVEINAHPEWFQAGVESKSFSAGGLNS